MSDRVILPLAGIGTLVLDGETYRKALEAGAALAGNAVRPPDDEPLMGAEELAEALKLPVTWLEQAAREQRIPSIQAGRWRRFRRSDVEQALARTANGAATAK